MVAVARNPKARLERGNGTREEGSQTTQNNRHNINGELSHRYRYVMLNFGGFIDLKVQSRHLSFRETHPRFHKVIHGRMTQKILNGSRQVQTESMEANIRCY